MLNTLATWSFLYWDRFLDFVSPWIGLSSLAVTVGADRAMNKTGRAKWHKNASHITMCIGRKGETSRIMEQFKKDQDSNKVNNSRFFFVPDELDNVSSTAIRQVLARLDYDACADTNKTQEIVDTLVTDQWISEKQGVYLVHNLSFLYPPFLPIHRVMCEAFLCHFARPVLFIALSAPTITATCIMSWFWSPDLNMSIFVLYPASAAEPIGW
jgi:hypothetical protein